MITKVRWHGILQLKQTKALSITSPPHPYRAFCNSAFITHPHTHTPTEDIYTIHTELAQPCEARCCNWINCCLQINLESQHTNDKCQQMPNWLSCKALWRYDSDQQFSIIQANVILHIVHAMVVDPLNKPVCHPDMAIKKNLYSCTIFSSRFFSTTLAYMWLV